MKQQIFSKMTHNDKVDFLESKKELLNLISCCLSAMLGGQISTLYLGKSSSKQRDVAALICCCLIICATFGPHIYKRAKSHIQLVSVLKQKYK